MPIRVCMMVYHYWPGPEGGTERQCRKLAAALSHRGVACTVLTARAYRGLPWSERDGAVRIVRVPTGDGFFRRPPAGAVTGHRTGVATVARPLLADGRAAGFARQATAWINSLWFQLAATLWLTRHAEEFDVVHVHTTEWIAGLAVWLGRRLRLPVLCKVATQPVFPDLAPSVPFRRLWDRERRRASFVALNESMARELRTTGVPAVSLRVIPNSVELPKIAERREESGLVLYVGNLTQQAWKAFDVLFDAWARVSRAEPSFRLAVLGSGDPAPWERLLEAAGCRDSVDFAGFVQDVDSYYRRAAVLVLPSRQEGMSNALLESQSWGIPAVVSDIDANRSVVTDGLNGVVVPVDDAASLTTAVLRLLHDDQLRRSLGAAARKVIDRRYSLPRVTDETIEVYQELVHPAAAGRRTPVSENAERGA